MIRAVIRFLRLLVSPWRRSNLTPTPVHVTPAGPESLLDETCRRAAELAALEPEQVIADGGPLERFVRGRHAALNDELSERTAERVAALKGSVDAKAADELAARAAAGRARSDWQRERAAEEEAAQRIADAETTVTRLQQERDKLSLREKGYLSEPMKWLLVILVAAALTPLVYLSMEFLDDPMWQIIVTFASCAGILVAEHALGFAIAHVAQHVPRWARLEALIWSGIVIGLCIFAAEYLAGELRYTVGEAAATSGGFNAADAAKGVVADTTPFVSMMWTVPLGIAATLAGSLVVAFYALGHPGRELEQQVKGAKDELRRVRDDHAAAEQRCADQRAALEAAETAADAVAGVARRAKEELQGAELANHHARDAQDGHLVSNLAAAEMAYHSARAQGAEAIRLKNAEDARRAEEEERRRREVAARNEQEEAERELRDERREARRKERAEKTAARRRRRAEAVHRAGRLIRVAAGHSADAVRAVGPATTSGLLVHGLGGPMLLSLGAAAAGLTATRLVTDARRARRRAETPVPMATVEHITPAGHVPALNGASSDDSRKESA
jgi:hypothetical protein